jgi:hypothetical protein
MNDEAWCLFDFGSKLTALPDKELARLLQTAPPKSTSNRPRVASLTSLLYQHLLKLYVFNPH